MKTIGVLSASLALFALSAVTFSQATPTDAFHVVVNVVADGKTVAKITIPGNVLVGFKAPEGGPYKGGTLLSGGATVSATVDADHVITIEGETLQLVQVTP